MHMADALISPVVGGAALAATVGLAAYSIKKIQTDFDDKKIPLMGVMGAFVFASQMINFTIPGTGSSGHIGGGMLLAILLGPHAGFLTMASVLLIQALFFGDGGLLAYGCNVFNLGFFTCFVAYPFIYKMITRKDINSRKLTIASIISVVVALQLGAFSVVLETLVSGKTELTFSTFVLLMQPIHLAIGIVEGIITAAVVSFVFKMRPEILNTLQSNNQVSSSASNSYQSNRSSKGLSFRNVTIVLLVAAFIIGGFVSWFASSNPDGLEWSMEKTAGTAEFEGTSSVHTFLESLQSKIAFLPDYGFKNAGDSQTAAYAGTTLSGIVGSVATLAIAIAIGFIVRKATFKKATTKQAATK